VGIQKELTELGSNPCETDWFPSVLEPMRVMCLYLTQSCTEREPVKKVVSGRVHLVRKSDWVKKGVIGRVHLGGYARERVMKG
jgi:hypothetical protein